ncbi:MAG: GntR family transcriptional regulator [Frankiales bacterium]|nr:GntR family transcriptional regulator [Frankiales bacterium]
MNRDFCEAPRRGRPTCTVWPVSIHRDLAEHLRRQILSGELGVGGPVPSEARLCQEWGVSRGPVRQALATLRAEGVIGGGRGAPPVVRSRQLSQPFETFLSFTRWARTTGRTPGQRTLEVSRIPAPRDAADALGIDPGEAVVALLRVRLLDNEPAMLERSTFTLDVGMPLLVADLNVDSIYDTLLRAGTDLISAHHVIDAVAADEVDAEHLGIAPGAPLLRERRHAATSGGETVEYSDDRYRPDLVSFTIINAQESPPALTRTWSPDAASA